MDENMNTTEEIVMVEMVEEKKKKEIFGPLSIVQAILINALIIAAAIIISTVVITHKTGVKDTADSGAPQAPVAVDIKNVNLEGEPFIGNPKAKVVIAFWSDFQCPFCKKFETTTFQSVLKDYVQNGTVAVVFKDFAFLGEDSTTAAEYARAVWNLYPDKYFAWREAMFNAQDGENTGFGDEASIVKLTATVPGFDAQKIQNDVKVNAEKYTKMIEADREEGASMGVQGTPSAIIGKNLVPGNVPYEAYKAAIKDAMN